MGDPAEAVSIEAICRSMGVRVEICDPFNLENTMATLLDVMKDESDGPRVVVMRHECELIRARREGPPYKVYVVPERCLGDACGCDRLCTRVFCCPGLVWNEKMGKSEIDEVICSGCGLCADICPQGAIVREASLPQHRELEQEILG